MSTSQVVLDYINALKWPVLVGGGLIWQRNAIKKAIAAFWARNQSGELHVPGVDLKWRNEVKELAAEVDQATEPSLENLGQREVIVADEGGDDVLNEANLAYVARAQRYTNSGDDWSTIERLIVTDPTGAVIRAWELLQERIRLMARLKAGVLVPENERDGNANMVALVRVIPDSTTTIINRLGQLRNEAAHGKRQIASEDAVEYVQTVRRVIYDLLPEVSLSTKE